MLRTAVIILALCLVACAASSGSAETASSEIAPSREGAAEVQQESAYSIGPRTFVCVPILNPARHPIPPGKQIKDLCPAGTIALMFPDPGATFRPNVVIHPTTFACFPQPLQRPRPVPPGKTTDFDDLCAPGETAWLFHARVPNFSRPPKPTDAAPPQPDTSEKAP